MKRHEQDRLLKEILGGEDMSEFRRASLDRGLNALHSIRRRRRVIRIGGLMAGLGILVVSAVLLGPSKKPTIVPGESAQPDMAASHPPPAPAAPVKRITDEELFALFPGRSLALIGPPGHQQLVFLDRPTGS